MANTKYKLTMAHLLQQSGIHRLERDGFTKSDIHNVLHREANEASRDEQAKIIGQLYDRKE